MVAYPTLSIDSKTYALALSYANSTTSPQAKIRSSETITNTSAPIVVDFSCRGPNLIIPEIMKCSKSRNLFNGRWSTTPGARAVVGVYRGLLPEWHEQRRDGAKLKADEGREGLKWAYGTSRDRVLGFCLVCSGVGGRKS